MEPENDDENKVNITGLTFGEKYEVVVVARDGAGNEKEGKPVTVTLGHTPGQYYIVKTVFQYSYFWSDVYSVVLIINNY